MASASLSPSRNFAMDDFETTIKVIVVGNGGVGKSSMTARYCKNIFTEDYKKTIGVDFMEKTIEQEDTGETVRLMIWDTAGQEEFDALTSRYYKGAGAAVLVFSTVDRDSFDDLPSWKSKVEAECGHIPMCLVQNKMDLIDQAVMSKEEVEDMARRLGMKLYRSCVKQDLNVREVFEYVAVEYMFSGGAIDNTDAVADITEYAPQPEKEGAMISMPPPVASTSAAQSTATNQVNAAETDNRAERGSAMQHKETKDDTDSKLESDSEFDHKEDEDTTVEHEDVAEPASRNQQVHLPLKQRQPKQQVDPHHAPFKSQPSKRRTGGKKEADCVIS